jgi:uncharacterized protein (DUF1684 family)
MSRSSIAIAIVAVSALMAGTSTYQDSIHEWQKARDTKLRAPDSWLALVNLLWLKPGDNSIRSVPGFSGIVRVSGNRVSLINGDRSERTLSYDEDKRDVIHAGSVSFYVIKRGDRFGLRVKDSQSKALRDFAGMKYFPVNPELHFQARFIPDVKKIPILNILGQTEMQESPGLVEFTYKRQQYRLRPIYEDKTLFFLFKDSTNRTQTYQAGRMLNTPLPKDGKVDLDFNRSYTPPCTFTPYATCPLPPKENALPFPVEAGELRYGKGHVEYAER